MEHHGLPELNEDSVLTCGCLREFRVGDMIRRTGLPAPDEVQARALDKDHTAEWTHHLGSPEKIFGWLNIIHNGVGPAGGRSFVGLKRQDPRSTP